MMTVKQVASLTGVSVRALQFYDEIGLLKPTKVTEAGYRLYDEAALEVLQQILFFKELDFTLKEIKAILDNPGFDKNAAYQKQRQLLQMKRDRLNALLGLLDKLIKGEPSMEFKEFDLSGYFRTLAEFKQTHTHEIITQFGSVEQFDEMVSQMRAREEEIADLAVKQYGSLENYTKALKNNFPEFLKNGPSVSPSEVSAIVEKGEVLTRRLLADQSKDAASPEVQEILEELVRFVDEQSKGTDRGTNYWAFMAENYLSNPTFIEGTDRKYGKGASNYIGLALKAYTGKR